MTERRAMDEKECLQAISEGESAYGLLLDADPKLERRFNRLCKTMAGLLSDVRKHFPDAEYYTASGGFNLMLGSSHNEDATKPQQELLALAGVGVEVGDGDF